MAKHIFYMLGPNYNSYTQMSLELSICKLLPIIIGQVKMLYDTLNKLQSISELKLLQCFKFLDRF